MYRFSFWDSFKAPEAHFLSMSFVKRLYKNKIWCFGAIDCQLNAENRVIKTHLMSVSSSYYPLGWFTSCDPAQRPTSWIILELPLMELVRNSFWKKVWNSDTRGFQVFSTISQGWRESNGLWMPNYSLSVGCIVVTTSVRLLSLRFASQQLKWTQKFLLLNWPNWYPW